MRLIDKILLAQDFAGASDDLLHSAIYLARTFESSIVPMHVLPDELDSQKIIDILTLNAEDKLKKSVEFIRSNGVEADKTILTYGSPHKGIVQGAVATNANVIMVGSGKYMSSERFNLGSTTEHIIQESEKPVFVVKHGTTLDVGNILCPVDFSPTSRQALKNAIAMAYRFKARLTILNVSEDKTVSWFNPGEVDEESKSARIERQNAEFDKFLEGFNLSGLEWAKVLSQGDPSASILKAAAEEKTDLLVMGTVGRTGISRLIMGSVTRKVIRHVPCSFVTIKTEDVIKLQLETSIADIEFHFELAGQLAEDGFYDAAINQYKRCLALSSMHVPTYFGIAKVFDKLDMPEKAKLYRESGREILDRIWYVKIEDEVRKFKSH